MNAEARKLAEEFESLGWTVERSRDHVIVWAPDRGEKLTLPTSAKRLDPEFYKKVKSKLRRARETKGPSSC